MDLNDFGGERLTWIPLTGPFEGIEIQIAYASPAVAVEFSRRLRSLGIWKDGIVPGRERQYLVEFCKTYVRNWRCGVHKDETCPDGCTIRPRRGSEPVPYQPEPMATLMWEARSLNDELHKAIGREEDFFGNASGG